MYSKLKFNPSVHAGDFPGFKEPSPSITYSIANIYEDQNTYEQLDENLHNKLLNAFKKITPIDGYLYVLDWQHQCYKFYPHKMTSGTSSKEWSLPILPNGDYYLFLDKNFRYGTLGHPWEMTMCIFGEKLLTAMHSEKPKLFRNPIRKKEEFRKY